MGSLVPLGIFAIEAFLIYLVGEALLAANRAGGGGEPGKMAAVWVALAIGVVISVIVYIASRGGTPEAPATRGGGHH